jgi:DNA-binding CsgD family transcriptional regulator
MAETVTNTTTTAIQRPEDEGTAVSGLSARRTGDTYRAPSVTSRQEDPYVVGLASAIIEVLQWLAIARVDSGGATGDGKQHVDVLTKKAPQRQLAVLIAGFARRCGLTNRESQILELSALGLMSKEIAGRLAVSPKTVDEHWRRIYRKWGHNSRPKILAEILTEALSAQPPKSLPPTPRRQELARPKKSPADIPSAGPVLTRQSTV